VLKKQYIREGEYVTDQTRFNYAWGLIKSKNRRDQTQGVLLLSGTRHLSTLQRLVTPRPDPSVWLQTGLTNRILTLVVYTRIDIYKEVPDRRRECLFYLALGHFKLGNYNDARKFNDSLLEFEPHNGQARALRTEIEDRVARGR
jgi:fission 1 protein